MLGGDHSQAMGSIQGMKRVFPDAKILWVDAHIDANTPNSSPSGNMHGMPVGFLSGEMRDYNNNPLMNIRDITYFGIRSYEPEEKDLIDSQNVLVIDSVDCVAENMDHIKSQVENYFFPDGKITPYWISFDIDGMCASEFTSTGTPEFGGIKREFMMKFFDTFLPHSLGMDFSEVNFKLTDSDRS